MSKEIASILLDIEAVMIRPHDKFTWASGIQSPIYCDNRKIIGFVNERRKVAESFVELIKQQHPDVEVIAGTSTAGIPHAAFISELMDLPMCYVRGSKKKHGTGSQIEGADVTGKKCVVIEDLISTGGSSLEAVEALQESDADVLGVVAIFTYGLDKAKTAFEERNIPYHTLSNIETLLETSVERGQLAQDDIAVVEDFLNSL